MNIKDIDLNLLVVLEALLEERNVTRAAVRVGLSQPALSNALSRLRSTFDDPLFVRTPKGMIPTTRAVSLAGPLAETIRSLKTLLKAGATFDPETSTQKFTVAATDYAEMIFLPSLCARLAEKAPHIRLEVRPLKEQIPQRDLENGEIDLAVGYFTDAPGSLYQQQLFSEDFVCLVRSEHPQAKKALTVKQYAACKHVLVAPWGGMLGTVDALLAQQGLEREIAVSTPHFLVAPLIVVDTDMIVTLPRRIATLVSMTRSLKVMEHPIGLGRFAVNQIWHARTHHEPAHQWLRSVLSSLKGIN